MATVVNNPPPVESNSNGGMGFFLAVLLLIIFIVFLFFYGLPYLRNSFSGLQIMVPGRVDVNVHTPQGGGAPQTK